jgi:hypothetical protein
VHGANGKLQAFGFCDFVFEESAMRAIRILRDLEVCDKRLLVKVDGKTQERLEKFIKDKQSPNSSEPAADKESKVDEDEKSENGDQPPTKLEQKNGSQASDFSEFLDDETRKEDERLVEDIERLLAETKFEQKINKNEQSKDQVDQKSDGPKPDVRVLFL